MSLKNNDFELQTTKSSSGFTFCSFHVLALYSVQTTITTFIKLKQPLDDAIPFECFRTVRTMYLKISTSLNIDQKIGETAWMCGPLHAP